MITSKCDGRRDKGKIHGWRMVEDGTKLRTVGENDELKDNEEEVAEDDITILHTAICFRLTFLFLY